MTRHRPATPFMIAAAHSVPNAVRLMRGEKVGIEDQVLVSLEGIQYVRPEKDQPDITAVRYADLGRMYVPLAHDKFIALMKRHGYAVYAMEDIQEMNNPKPKPEPKPKPPRPFKPMM